MSGSNWLNLGTLEQMPRGIRTVKHGGHQLAVIRAEEGVHVIDNRCPHEGYPLAQGELQGCVLTCAWHNWKFDVTDGSCLLGGEGVRRPGEERARFRARRPLRRLSLVQAAEKGA